MHFERFYLSSSWIHHEWRWLLPVVQSIANHSPVRSLAGHSPCEMFTGLPRQNPLHVVVINSKVVQSSQERTRDCTEALESLRNEIQAMHQDAAPNATALPKPTCGALTDVQNPTSTLVTTC